MSQERLLGNIKARCVRPEWSISVTSARARKLQCSVLQTRLCFAALAIKGMLLVSVSDVVGKGSLPAMKEIHPLKGCNTHLYSSNGIAFAKLCSICCTFVLLGCDYQCVDLAIF